MGAGRSLGRPLPALASHHSQPRLPCPAALALWRCAGRGCLSVLCCVPPGCSACLRLPQCAVLRATRLLSLPPLLVLRDIGHTPRRLAGPACPQSCDQASELCCMQIWCLALPFGMWAEGPTIAGFIGVMLVATLLLVSRQQAQPGCTMLPLACWQCSRRPGRCCLGGLPAAAAARWRDAALALAADHLCPPSPPPFCGCSPATRWRSRWSCPSSSSPWTTCWPPTDSTLAGRQPAAGLYGGGRLRALPCMAGSEGPASLLRGTGDVPFRPAVCATWLPSPPCQRLLLAPAGSSGSVQPSKPQSWQRAQERRRQGCPQSNKQQQQQQQQQT